MENKEKERNSKIDEIQRNQYIFPYHYIPAVDKFPNFSKQWVFAASYIAAVKLVISWLENINLKKGHTHVDFGCGDGAFLINIKRHVKIKNVNFVGVDVDDKAIRWAQMFDDTPQMFRCTNISELPAANFDSGTLIEVIEHIPPSELPKFIDVIARTLKAGAEILVTVPSVEKPLTDKHYQHFDFQNISEYLEEHFEILELFGFDKATFLSRLLKKITHNSFYILEVPFINKLLIADAMFKNKSIRKCGRILIRARKKQLNNEELT